jgi:uncharacterized protein (DUF1800 family)
MQFRHRVFALALTLIFLAQLAPVAALAQQPLPSPLEPMVARIRDGLKLNEDQVRELRQVLAKHEPKLNEMRRRAQVNPYAPGLQPEVDKEQRAIREEMTAFLSEEQKAKLATFDARLPVPLGPPYLLVNLPPRTIAEAPAANATSLASRERLIAAASPSAKGRAARLGEDQKILHLLNRITFGPRPGDIERVRVMGLDKFLESQLRPEMIDDAEVEKRLAVLPTQQMSSLELFQFYPPPQIAEQRAGEKNQPPVYGRPQQIYGELVQQKLVRAVSSNRQLQEVMTDFWFNHFNVFAQKDADQWFVSSYERDVIRPLALGKFRDLLLATAQSPAMMFYLDNWLSFATDAKEPRPPAPPRPPNTPPMKENPKPAPGASSAATAMEMPAKDGTNTKAISRDGAGANVIDDAMLLAQVNGSPQAEEFKSQISNLKSATPNAGSPQQPANPQSSTPPSMKPEAQSSQPAKPDGQLSAQQAKPDPSTQQQAKPDAQSPQQPKPAPPKPTPQPQRKRGVNENYARELMELHTLGVDGGYTQKDVQEVARCFTGWTIDRPYQGGSFVYRPWMHDAGSKTVLGITIPAGGGMSDGLRVIDILSRHPSTARFVAKKLCQRFIADDPPPQLIERVAQVFLKTEGDIREVLRAILTSPEFYSVTTFRAKVKSPLELTASAIRAIDGDTNGAPALHEWLRRMGEPLYQYAFPTGYSEQSEKWVNTGVFFNRINFAVAFANRQIAGTGYDPARLVSMTGSDDEIMAQLAALITHTELSADSRRAVLAGLAQQAPTTASQPQPAIADGRKPAPVPVKADGKLDTAAQQRLAQLIALLFGTAEFQRR